jgi:phosphoenolpyruvate-protein kinase (PTS system EI component)
MSRAIEIYHQTKKFEDMMTREELAEYRKEKLINVVSETAAQLVDDFNASGSKDDVIEGIIQGITKSHRHLQGEFWMAMAEVCKKYSELDDRYFDPRNAFAKDMTKRMSEGAMNF